VSLHRQLRATFQTTLVLTGILAAANAFPQTPEPSISALLAQAATYERQFEQEFRTMVGQEHYEQRWGGFSAELETSSDRQRVIESEVLFVWLQEEESWLTARNVRIVDDSPVRDSESRLERLLTAPTDDWVARVRRLRDESARFNLGPVERNFNDPTMVVQFLSAKVQPRFRFEGRGRDKVDGKLVWRLTFTEHVLPTLIQSNGNDVPATGDVWIDATDGAIVRTRVSLRDTRPSFRLQARIDVTYRRDQRFAVWVPSRMQESYERSGRRVYLGQTRSFEDRIDCVATYTDFRRFETTGRLMPR
jgi:hypothetical protein